MTLDLASLWDFRDPAGSEQRFRAALARASAHDALILETQIARTFGLRGDFVRARELLERIAPGVAAAGGEAHIRHALELGRTWVSAVHPAAAVDDDARTRARAHYEHARSLARAARRDDLEIDALHMLAFVDNAPEQQLAWGRAALAVLESSSQPAARRWEGSLRNNVGYALHQLGRYDEALGEFVRARTACERTRNPVTIRIANWMVAWTLRALGRLDEALEIQLRLERECAAAGAPDPHVFEELEALYRARGDLERASAYAERRAAARA